MSIGFGPDAVSFNTTDNRACFLNAHSSTVSVIADVLAGTKESREPLASGPKPGPTIVRGVLTLPRPETRSGLPDNPVMSHAALLDAAGRKVRDLVAGANAVSGLTPSIYFVRHASGVGCEASSIHKVVLTD